ncbi:MAG: hypothetical protein S4CHLAM102_15910 [Chlamydiia bacterium]|nr:hypothetical protein [Chlamydiia bacterium]
MGGGARALEPPMFIQDVVTGTGFRRSWERNVYRVTPSDHNAQVSTLFDFTSKFFTLLPTLHNGVCSSGSLGQAPVRESAETFSIKIKGMIEIQQKEIAGSGASLLGRMRHIFPNGAQSVHQFEAEFFRRLARVNEKFADSPLESQKYLDEVLSIGSISAGEVYKKIGHISPLSRELTIKQSLTDKYAVFNDSHPILKGGMELCPPAVPMILSEEIVFKHWVLNTVEIPTCATANTPEFMSVCGFRVVPDLAPGDVVVFYKSAAMQNLRTKKVEEFYLADGWGYVGAEGRVQMSWADDPQVYEAPLELLPERFNLFQVFRKEDRQSLSAGEVVDKILQLEGVCLKEGLDYFQERVTALLGIKHFNKKRPKLDKEGVLTRLKDPILASELVSIATSFEGALSTVVESPSPRHNFYSVLQYKTRELAAFLIGYEGNLKLLPTALRECVWPTIRMEIQASFREVLIRSMKALANSRGLLQESALKGAKNVLPTIDDKLPAPFGGGEEGLGEDPELLDLLDEIKLGVEETGHVVSDLMVMREGAGGAGVASQALELQADGASSSIDAVEAYLEGVLEAQRTITMSAPFDLPEGAVFSIDTLQRAQEALVQIEELETAKNYHELLHAWGLANYPWENFSGAVARFDPTRVKPKGRFAFVRCPI